MLGQEIVEVRTALGLTRAQFALVMNVSEPTIYYWESEKYAPSRYDHIVLARLYYLLHRDRAGFERVRGKIRQVLALDPEPRRDVSAESLLVGGLAGFGLGLLLQSLFGQEEHPGPPRHRRRDGGRRGR